MLLNAFKLLINDPVLFLKTIKSNIIGIYKVYILKDKNALEAKRWFRDNGDKTLRLNYSNLDNTSIIFDLGGYLGDFASEIYKKYKCKVYVFEPHPIFYQSCMNRFKNFNKVTVLNYGISNKDEVLDLTDNNDNSSIYENHHNAKKTIKCNFKSFNSVIFSLGIKKIDLMKINIEGGEYNLLEFLIKTKQLEIAKNYQIQFHDFVSDAVNKRKNIINEFNKKFIQTWSYEFVWENWTIKD